MKKIVSTAVLACCMHLSRAQTVTPEVIASDGGYATSSQGSVSWSIGEPVSETYTNGSNITTMGFHQPIMEVATLIREQGGEKELLVYPNPVNDHLTVDLTGLKPGQYRLMLTDAAGKQITASETAVNAGSGKTLLKLEEVASGVYFLSVKGDDFEKTIKLTKTH